MGRVRVLLVVAVMFGSSGCLWMARSSVPSDPAAVQGNGASTRPALSQGGRYVAFESVATNLVAGDTNGVRDVFVRGGLAWGAPSLSDDGTRVAYGEFAAPDQLGNSTYDAVIADTAAATVVAIVAGGSLSHQGQSYFEVVLSGDGTAAAFTYSNFQIGTLQRFDVTLGQLVPVLDDLAGPRSVRISDDGNVFALMVGADFVLTDAAGTPPRIVSASPSGTSASSLDGLTADLSGDALFVAFASADPTLLPDDTNAAADIFTRATKHATAPS